MLDFKTAIPLSIYIHLPWCVKKCPYCDFNSHEAKLDQAQFSGYLRALIRDLEYSLPDIRGRQITSVFIGGGTPSLFPAETITDLMSALRARLNLYPNSEVTLEANPGTADADNFAGYREAGVNRLSIGVQSFDANQLTRLGRIHGHNEAIQAVELARSAGFEYFNIDLMFGLPDQTIASALSDLETAISLQPGHISWYQLTIEPNTVFYSRPPVLPDDDYLWDMQQAGQALLVENGYEQYEISAYAKANRYCQHNLNYWEFGDYLGIGAGAHSKLTNLAMGEVTRCSRHRIPARFIELAGSKQAIINQCTLSRRKLPLEFMLNAMRLRKGVTADSFKERTGLSMSAIEAQLNRSESEGFLDLSLQRLAPTEKGQRYLDDFLIFFL